MSAVTKRTQRYSGTAFKLGGVGAVEKGEMTDKQAQRKYCMQERSTVVWLRKYGQHDCQKDI